MPDQWLPNSCPTHVQHMSNTCLKHVLGLSNACPTPLYVISNVCITPVQRLSDTCPMPDQGLSNSCPTPVQHLTPIENRKISPTLLYCWWVYKLRCSAPLAPPPPWPSPRWGEAGAGRMLESRSHQAWSLKWMRDTNTQSNTSKHKTRNQNLQ